MPGVIVNRTHRPSRLSVIVKTSTGSPITRWAQDEPNLENVFSGLTFSGEMPGGHKELTLRLARDPKRSYRDLALFNRIEVYSSDGERVWCGTIRQEPEDDGAQSIEVKAAGDMQFLEDDPTIVGPGFIDRDLSRWGEPSLSRKKVLNEGTFSAAGPNQPCVEASAGSGDDALPGLLFRLGQVEEGHTPIGELWYRSGGPAIGSISFNGVVTPSSLTEDANMDNKIDAARDDDANGQENIFTAHQTPAPSHGALPSTSGLTRLIAFMAFTRSIPTADYPDAYSFEFPTVLGDQGLAAHGVFPDIGFLAQQMIPLILEGSVLSTDPELLEDDGFVIPQAWFAAPGTRMSKLVEVTKYGLLDWFVFGDRILQYRFPGTYGRTWRLGPGNGPKNSGADANQVFDRLMVSYQDVDGTTKYTDLLTTTDPSNPAAAAGVPRGKLLALNGVCTEELALEVRQRAFEELQNLSQSGEVTLTDHVQDEASGAWYPVSYVQPGDRVREQSNGHERKVTSTSYADESVSNDLTIGAPPEGMGAIEARFNGRLIELGLG